MSLLELRERLAMTKEKHKVEEEAKRNQISADKKRFDQRLQMAAEKVQAHRLQKQKVFFETAFGNYNFLFHQ